MPAMVECAAFMPGVPNREKLNCINSDPSIYSTQCNGADYEIADLLKATSWS